MNKPRTTYGIVDSPTLAFAEMRLRQILNSGEDQRTKLNRINRRTASLGHMKKLVAWYEVLRDEFPKMTFDTRQCAMQLSELEIKLNEQAVYVLNHGGTKEDWFDANHGPVTVDPMRGRRKIKV